MAVCPGGARSAVARYAGRADAVYCGDVCRLRAYRDRVHPGGPGKDLLDVAKLRRLTPRAWPGALAARLAAGAAWPWW